MSPVFGSVTAASPSCKPVRREVLSTSGTARTILLDVGDHPVGFLERTAGRHHVVEDEAAFVHGRKQVAAQMVVAHVGNDDQNRAEARQPDGMLQRAAQPALVEFEDALEPASLAGRLLRPPSCAASVPLRKTRQIRPAARDPGPAGRRTNSRSLRVAQFVSIDSGVRACGESGKCRDWSSNPERSTSDVKQRNAHGHRPERGRKFPSRR